MKALQACGAWIDYQHITSVSSGEMLVTHYAEYVRMPAHEHIGAIAVYELAGMEIVMARVPSDMGHQYAEALPLEMAVQGIIIHKATLITVSHDTDKRLERSYAGCCFIAASEVPGVPYFIAIAEELPETVVEYAVGV